jgi:hypothetical protein
VIISVIRPYSYALARILIIVGPRTSVHECAGAPLHHTEGSPMGYMGVLRRRECASAGVLFTSLGGDSSSTATT